MLRIVVFLGPSLSRDLATRILGEADYKPPAARGDLIYEADHGADIIGLIDGVFYQKAAVAHREILYAIQKGITVVGGSSMGALRASELDCYGMIGAGKIYGWYKEGIIVSDDEVALAFHPDSLRPLSEPLVNIRATLDSMLRNNEVTEDEYDVIMKAARETPFQLRNRMRIIQKALGLGLSRERARGIQEVMKERHVDQKGNDAIEVLQRIRQIAMPSR